MAKDSTLTITGLRVRAVAAPMRLPLQTATGAISVAPLVLIDLETSAGITGRSYLFAIAQPHVKPIVALLEAMGEMLSGDAVAPFEIERKLRRKYTLLGVHNIVLFAMSGIDMAAWDACAQALGQAAGQRAGRRTAAGPGLQLQGPGHHGAQAAREGGGAAREGGVLRGQAAARASPIRRTTSRRCAR